MNRVVQLLLCFVYGWLVLIQTLFRIIVHGKSFFVVKNRETPPPCLLDPSLGRHAYIKLKDVKLHYVSNGDQNKTLMVLIHGFPEFWFSWRHQIKEFSREYWVVAVDLRGYGESDKPAGVDAYTKDKVAEDIREFIYALGRENAIVVGHDWGGLVSYMLAAKYPETVIRLVIANAPHPRAFQDVLESSWSQFFKSWYMHFFQWPYLPEFVLRGEDLKIFKNMLQSPKRRPCSDEEIEAYKYIYSRHSALTPPLNYYRAIKPLGSDAFRITVPTLLVWGDQDSALHILIATTSSKYVDNFNLRVVEGASHFVHIDDPDEFNRHTLQFLRS